MPDVCPSCQTARRPSSGVRTLWEQKDGQTRHPLVPWRAVMQVVKLITMSQLSICMHWQVVPTMGNPGVWHLEPRDTCIMSRYEAHAPRTELLEELEAFTVGVDRPSYGQSDPHPRRTLQSWTQDVARLADELGIDKFFLVGVRCLLPAAPAQGLRRSSPACMHLDTPWPPVRRAPDCVGAHQKWLWVLASCTQQAHACTVLDH